MSTLLERVDHADKMDTSAKIARLGILQGQKEVLRRETADRFAGATREIQAEIDYICNLLGAIRP